MLAVYMISQSSTSLIQLTNTSCNYIGVHILLCQFVYIVSCVFLCVSPLLPHPSSSAYNSWSYYHDLTVEVGDKIQGKLMGWSVCGGLNVCWLEEMKS